MIQLGEWGPPKKDDDDYIEDDNGDYDTDLNDDNNDYGIVDDDDGDVCNISENYNCDDDDDDRDGSDHYGWLGMRVRGFPR